MQKAEQAGVCSTHVWAKEMPCEGCKREQELLDLQWRKWRDDLAMRLLVAHSLPQSMLESHAVRGALCSSIILLADEMVRQLHEKV